MEKKRLGYIYKRLHCQAGNYSGYCFWGANTSKYEIGIAFGTVIIRQFSKIKVLD